MKNIIEAIFAFPSIILGLIVENAKELWIEEKEIATKGEYDQEEIDDERVERQNTTDK